MPGEDYGEEEDAQFVAHSLETGDDDWVTARLTINHLTLEVSKQS